MTEPVLVSIGLAVYNGEAFIARAINSILKQSYPHWELIIVNDGSSDNTCSIINTFKDPRIKLINNSKNLGVTPTRNKYVRAATGKYLAVIDADDEWYPTKLEKQVLFLEGNPDYVLCGTYANRTNGSTGYIWQYPNEDEAIRIRLLWGSAIIHSSILIRKSVLDKQKICYDTGQVQAEDYKLICDCIKHGKAHNLPEILLNYHEHDEQLTTKKDEQVLHSAKAAWHYINNIACINISDKYFEAFYRLFAYEKTLDSSVLNEIGQLLFLILKNERKWFDISLLQDSVAARFYIACSFHRPSLSALWQYTQKGLLSKKHVCKLLIKHLLKQ